MQSVTRVDLEGGIGIIEMHYKTNMIAIVGGGKFPKYPPNKVMIWNDHTKRCCAEFTFLTDVKGVKLRREKYSKIFAKKIFQE